MTENEEYKVYRQIKVLADPTWDYYELLTLLSILHDQIGDLIRFVSRFEHSEVPINQSINARLSDIVQALSKESQNWIEDDM